MVRGSQRCISHLFKVFVLLAFNFNYADEFLLFYLYMWTLRFALRYLSIYECEEVFVD